MEICTICYQKFSMCQETHCVKKMSVEDRGKAFLAHRQEMEKRFFDANYNPRKIENVKKKSILNPTQKRILKNMKKR
jgi:hypothetical protein